MLTKMHIYPMRKMIIICGLHFQNVSARTTSEEYLNKILGDMKFKQTDEIKDQNITILKSSDYKDDSKITQLIINLENLISEIHYYTIKK